MLINDINEEMDIKEIYGELVVSSQEIAKDFGKEHLYVLSSINEIIEEVLKLNLGEAFEEEITPFKNDIFSYALFNLESEVVSSGGAVLFIPVLRDVVGNSEYYMKEYLVTYSGFSLLASYFNDVDNTHKKTLRYMMALDKKRKELNSSSYSKQDLYSKVKENLYGILADSIKHDVEIKKIENMIDDINEFLGQMFI